MNIIFCIIVAIVNLINGKNHNTIAKDIVKNNRNNAQNDVENSNNNEKKNISIAISIGKNNNNNAKKIPKIIITMLRIVLK